MKLLLFLVLVATSLTTTVAAAQSTVALQPLAFACVAIDPNQEFVVQFEREIFPTYADTGLFPTRGQELLYVERGELAVVGDSIGKTVQGEGFWDLIGENRTLGLRNVARDEASVVWLRLLPSDAAQAAAFMAPGALRAAEATRHMQQAPLFFEFQLPGSLFDGSAYLFMTRLSVGQVFASDVLGKPMINDGLALLVIEEGQLAVSDNDGITHDLAEGEAMTIIAGDSLTTIGPGPVSAYLVGLVATYEGGLVGTRFGSADWEKDCPKS